MYSDIMQNVFIELLSIIVLYAVCGTMPVNLINKIPRDK